MNTRKILTSLLFVVFICTASGYAQCIDRMHTPFFEDAWLSCEKSENPNEGRPASHWLLLDLGHAYTLDSTYFWNYNVWGESELGLKDVAIDYSLDGENWTSLDTFRLPKAPASVKYHGAAGPVLDNLVARYLLLTGISNWAGNEVCMGLSELLLQVNEPTSNDPEIVMEEQSLNIFPNPVGDQLTVSVKSENRPNGLRIMDMAGRVIIERNTLESNNIQLDVSKLPASVYIIEISVNDGFIRDKFVKSGS